MSANDFASLDHPKYFYQLFLPPPELDSNTSRGCGPHDYRGGWGKPFLPLFPIWSRQSHHIVFYGNGETAVDYDEIAPCYSQIGVNFFIADYLGYGGSSGSPTYGSMLSDAHKVLEELQAILSAGGYGGPIYVMGRSMGRHPAFELGARTPDMVKGMIIESGRPTLGQFLHGLEPALATRLEASYLDKVRSVQLPVLVIHGEQDSLAPVQQAVDMYHDFVSPNKRLLTIPGAGHNDLLNLGVREYFEAIRGFVAGDSAQ